MDKLRENKEEEIELSEEQKKQLANEYYQKLTGEQLPGDADAEQQNIEEEMFSLDEAQRAAANQREQQEIDREKLEEEASVGEEPVSEDDEKFDFGEEPGGGGGGAPRNFNSNFKERNPIEDLANEAGEEGGEEAGGAEVEVQTGGGETAELPDMGSLGIDFTDNT